MKTFRRRYLGAVNPDCIYGFIVFNCVWKLHILFAILRSFTLKCPQSEGSNIGVVLYQRAFFVSKASADRAKELTGRDTYATGGMTLGWEQGLENA